MFYHCLWCCIVLKMVDTGMFRLLLVGYVYMFSSQADANDVNTQFCWNGTEENLSGWMNMSCSTGISTLGNSLSTKILPSGEGGHIDTRSVKGTYCMAFKYLDNSQLHEGGEDTTVVTYTAIYTCDIHNKCQGRNMMEGYKDNYEGHNGTLYCCDSGNNCNKHAIIQSPTHHHTCYTSQADNSQSPTIKIAHEASCQDERRHCMHIIVNEGLQNGSRKRVRETFKCDEELICEALNLTRANDHDCLRREIQANQTEEVCCCKGDRCFVPAWLKEPPTKPALTNPMQSQTTWQRTVLIILGVALGILVVSVTMFFVRRSITSTKSNESPTRNAHMAYKSVNNEDAMFDDNVQMLSAYK